MIRADFCQLLLRYKGDTPLSHISYKCEMDKEVLRRIFNGSVNFYVETSIKVAHALHTRIIIKNGTTRFEINNPLTLTRWAQISQKESGLSVNKFKDEIGLTRVALTANLKGESKMRIDTLLKWAEVTGYEVELCN